MFLTSLGEAAPRLARLRLRRHRPHPAHVLALHRPEASGPSRPTRPPSIATPSRRSTRRTTRSSARCMATLGPRDLLMVISDHGFSSFRRGVNLNAWLHREGYLTLKDGADGSAEWLRDVDWSKTRAYCLGLSGLFLNLRGREASGIVAPGDEARALKAELIAKLTEPAGRGRRRHRRARGLRHDGALPGAVLRERAGPRHRLQRRLSHVVGLRHRHGRPARCSRTTPRRGAATTASTRASCRASCSATARSTRRATCRSWTSRPTALRLFGLEPPPHMDGRPWAVAP